MRLSLLGTFAARHDGHGVELGRRQERLLLALLTLEPGRHLSIDRLVDLIWDDQPPASARGAIHTYVARLRTALKPYGVTISGQATGYLLGGAMDVDVAEAFELSGRADQEPNPSARAELLRAALDLWRGPFLADLAGERLRDRIGGPVADLRRRCLVRRGDALLALGRPDQVTVELAPEVAGALPHESLVAHQMLALYRTHRRADALALFDRVRREMADEYGLDPAPELVTLQLAILRDDPEMTGPSTGITATTPQVRTPTGPNQLPRAIPDFVGREPDLAAIDSLTGADGGICAITAIGGTPGVGKTAIAIEWAHRAADRFPDGLFYINLRGYDVESPVSTIEALTSFLAALGQRSDSIPTDEAAAAALYRSLLADQRALVILDNARSADQVRPLLPNSRRSVVLITSRDRLTGLVARDGARVHALDVMSPEESRRLLERLIGANRLGAEPAAAERLTDLVGQLPLALRVIGAHLAVAPSATLSSMVAAMEAGRLEPLEVDDDPRSNVRSLFRISYDALDSADQRMFRLLGTTPYAEVPAAAVAALLGIREDVAVIGLRRLSDLSLIMLTGGRNSVDRYGMHDLMREFARERAACDERLDDRQAALSRIVGWYVERTRAAGVALGPSVVRLPAPDPEPFESPENANAFLDAETDNILATIHTAAGWADPSPSWQLVDAVRGFWWNRRRHVWWDAAAVTLAAARRIDDPLGLVSACLGLGGLANWTGQLDQAADLYREAIESSQRTNWPGGAAAAWGNLGTTRYYRGELDEAAACHHRALEINRAEGRHGTCGINLTNLSLVQGRMGRLSDAADSLRAAVELFTEVADKNALPVALHNLGNMLQRLGQLDEAADCYERALPLYQLLNNSDGEGLVTSSYAALRRDEGRLTEAVELARHATKVLSDANEDASLMMARNTYASIRLRQAEPAEALTIYQESIATADALHLPRPKAEALVGSARAYLRLEDPVSAEKIVQAALSIAELHAMPLIIADALHTRAEIAAVTDPRAARELAQRALEAYENAGAVVDAATVRRFLTGLP